MADVVKKKDEVRRVFDELSEEIYYSLNFRMTLRQNPYLLAWAKHLVNKVKEDRNTKTIKKGNNELS